MSESERPVYVTLPIGVMPRPPMTQRIPIPADVFAAMVERGAGAMFEDTFGGLGYRFEDIAGSLQQVNREQAAVCIRAALGISDE